ncbi:hypothetical protein TCAL_13743, partial [Tigriopus californicus]
SPTILPRHQVTEKYVLSIHRINYHASARLTLSIIRQSRWLQGGRKYLKSILNKCPELRCSKPSTYQTKMAPLPPERIENASPFEHKELRKVKKNAHQGISHMGPRLQCIQWHFSTQLAPWTNAIVERLIREVKNALRKTVGSAKLPFRSLENTLIECEGIINSRPLGFLSDDGREGLTVTPFDLLYGRPRELLPYSSVKQCDSTLARKWINRKNVLNQFWKNWRHQYLLDLQFTKKWSTNRPCPLKVGDVVLISEKHLSRNHWVLGRILELIPGRDGIIRSAIIKTTSSKHPIRRPISQLSFFELNNHA